MSGDELRPRRGASIREFLRYYVLALLQRRGLTAKALVLAIKEDSADNRTYRPSGQLLVDGRDLDTVLAQLRRRGLIEPVRSKWRLTKAGRRKLASYERQKEKRPGGKEKAARRLLKLMGPCRPGQQVLDVGTGEGFLAFKVAEEGCRVLGIDSGSFDYSKDSIETATQKAESQGGQVEFRQTPVANLRGMDGTFDCVVTSQAIHCMKDQFRCIEAIYGHLKPGGMFLCMDFLVGLEGFLHHGWHAFLAISRKEWEGLLPQCGFEEPRTYKTGDYLVVSARKPLSRPEGSS